jgi:hypothetical protein
VLIETTRDKERNNSDMISLSTTNFSDIFAGCKRILVAWIPDFCKFTVLFSHQILTILERRRPP